MSEGFRDRLARLRRDPPRVGATDGAPAPSGPSPQRVRELLASRERRAARGPATLPRGVAPSASGGFLEREYAVDARSPHGDWPCALALDAAADAIAMLAKDEALCAFDPSRAVYLDIETTGLAGGAGTWPFLVALGSFDPTGGSPRFNVWQGFLGDPSQERALLAHVAERVREAGAIVSFFGKSFDRHRLEDKMRVHGIAPPFRDALHLDLYHPFRRLYGKGLADGRLGTLERELLAFRRIDDLPGSQAPAAWFDFLAGRAHRLDAVFEHNRLDVVSLAALLAHLGRTLDERGPGDRPLSGAALWRAIGLFETYEKRKDWASALSWCERATDRFDALDAQERARLAAVGDALAAKRARLAARVAGLTARSSRDRTR